MQFFQTHRKAFYIILACVVIVTVGIAIYLWRVRTAAPVTTNKTITFNIAPVATGTLPDLFPTDFPFEKGAEILFAMNLSNGVQGGELAFLSSSTVAGNYTLYQRYLARHGWKQDVSPKVLQALAKVLPAGSWEIQADNASGTLKTIIFFGPYQSSTQIEVDARFTDIMF